MAAITTYGTLQTAIADYLARSDLSAQTTDYLIPLAEQRIYFGAKNPNLPGYDSPPIRVRAMEATYDVTINAANSGGTDSGTANTYAATVSGITSLTRGLVVFFIVSNSSTGASTFNLNGLGATAIKKGDGTVDIAQGDLLAGETQYLYYDGTYWRLIDQGYIPLPPSYLQMRRFYLNTTPITSLNYLTPEQMLDTGAASTVAQPKSYTIEGEYVRLAPIPDATYYGRFLYYKRLSAMSASSDTNWFVTNSPGLYLYGSLLEAAILMKNWDEANQFMQMYNASASGLTDANQLDRWSGSILTIRSDVGNP